MSCGKDSSLGKEQALSTYNVFLNFTTVNRYSDFPVKEFR